MGSCHSLGGWGFDKGAGLMVNAGYKGRLVRHEFRGGDLRCLARSPRLSPGIQVPKDLALRNCCGWPCCAGCWVWRRHCSGPAPPSLPQNRLSQLQQVWPRSLRRRPLRQHRFQPQRSRRSRLPHLRWSRLPRRRLFRLLCRRRSLRQCQLPTRARPAPQRKIG